MLTFGPLICSICNILDNTLSYIFKIFWNIIIHFWFRMRAMDAHTHKESAFVHSDTIGKASRLVHILRSLVKDHRLCALSTCSSSSSSLEMLSFDLIFIIFESDFFLFFHSFFFVCLSILRPSVTKKRELSVTMGWRPFVLILMWMLHEH